jgi:tRNA-splicing ligase RtcB (3'-phosphate/5'-hydroxy nucleic acid ligase)
MDGNDILALGFPKGKCIGMALQYASFLESKGWAEANIKTALRNTLNQPGHSLQYPTYPEETVLAQELVDRKNRETIFSFYERGNVAPYKVWGDHLIDQQTKDQMENALRVPVALQGALMPDGHLGYGLPIGGVLAADNAVIPYAVGVDIACRMMLTVTNYKVTDMLMSGGGLPDFSKSGKLARAIENETRFGAGASFGRTPRQHPILDDPRWGDIPFLRTLKNTGRSQLGSSGGGNHFVEFGVFKNDQRMKTPFGSIPKGQWLALLSHSGSRGVGFKIANHYTRVAKEKCRGIPKELEHLAWLSLDDPDGIEYWEAMNFAGDYASACHHSIHESVLRAAGLSPLCHVENHHNFAWKEQVVVNGERREAVVHRKGATPAGKGVLGLIPGTMADTSLLVRGLGNEESMNSSSHGAGRAMSRTQAIKTLDNDQARNYLSKNDVTLLGASLDEAPGAYKDIREVIQAQSDLVEVVGHFDPHLVKMAGDKSPI